MKRICIYLMLAMTLLCAGCGSVFDFDKEYLYEEEYSFDTQDQKQAEADAIANFTGLKAAIEDIVDQGQTEGTLRFSEKYTGNIAEDMPNACWQVRSQNALCVYCVGNISYEISQILSYSEALVQVMYYPNAIPVSDIHRLQYSTGLDDIINTSISNLDTRLAILVNRSSLSSSDLSALISSTYRSNPLLCPAEPQPLIKMYSGSNSQRLYEIELEYGTDTQTLTQRKQELDDLTLFTEEERNLSDLEKTKVVWTRLKEVVPGEGNSVYDALVTKCADDEGVALGFTGLGREIGLNCCCVYGQKDFEDYCWNMVQIDGVYYHVDMTGTTDTLGLISDKDMWLYYRWDITSYPACGGESQEIRMVPEEKMEQPEVSEQSA